MVVCLILVICKIGLSALKVVRYQYFYNICKVAFKLYTEKSPSYLKQTCHVKSQKLKLDLKNDK